MVHLSGIDLCVVGLFLLCVLSLGFSARLRDNSILQYLAAGRSLSLSAFVATLVCTWYGGILGVGESIQYYGLGTWLLFGVPYYVFALLYAWGYAKRVRAAEQISIPERLAKLWGQPVGLLAAVLVFLLAVPAAHVLMLGILLRSVTPYLDLREAIIVATLVGTLFLYKGGLLADVRASMLAFVMMYLGFAIIVGYCLWHFPPAETFRKIDPSLMHWTGGQGILPVIGFFVLGSWTLVDPGFHQRVASAMDPSTGRRGVVISVFFWFIFDVLTTVAGLYGLALVKPQGDGLQLYPSLGDQVLPNGLRGLFFCGMLGTILCAMVGYTLVSGATLGREIVGRARGNLTDAETKLWTRIGFFVACVVAIVLAIQLKSVVDLWYDWGGTVVGALLFPVTAAYVPQFRLRAASGWVFASMLAAFLLSFGGLVLGKRTGHAYFEVYIAGQNLSLGTVIPGLMVSAAVLGIGQVAARRTRSNGR